MSTIALNNILVITRGDTCSFTLSIADASDNDGHYNLQGNDTVYFGVMEPNQKFEDAIIKKVYMESTEPNSHIIEVGAADNIEIILEPEDTVDLEPGIYYYSVKLKQDHYNDEEHINSVKTIIDKTKLIICD